MERRSSTEWFGRLAGTAAVLFGVVATSTSAFALHVDLEEVRSYRVPEGFSLGQTIVRSNSEGTTLVAATSGNGANAACTVVVASPDSARAFPYRRGSNGSACVGAIPHPDGGFFVRGFGAGAEPGDVAGFTARIDGSGRERWLLPDTDIAESSELRGTYRRPHPAMAYSAERDRLLAFTVSRLTLEMLGERELTFASVVEDGKRQLAAQSLGTSEGTGVLRGVETLERSGDFLVYVSEPTTEGGQFVTFDGRQNVEAFEPLGEDWSERFVRRIEYGPDGKIYLLWTDAREQDRPTKLTVVDTEGGEVWSGEFSASARVDGESRTLGSPQSFWVGASYVFVLYSSDPVFVRVLDASTGEQKGIVQLTGATEYRALSFVRGPDAQLRLLTVDTRNGRFRELRVTFEPDAPTGDAGLSDGGFADGGRNPGYGQNEDGNDGGGGGCSVGGTERRGSQPATWCALVALLLAGGRRFGGRSSAR